MTEDLEWKNEMLVMVLTDLVAICKKITAVSPLPEDLRMQAGEYVEEYNSLLPARGKGTPFQHDLGEALLIRVARFLPRVLEVEAKPRGIGERAAV